MGMTAPSEEGLRFFGILGLGVGSAGVVVSGVVGLQKWIGREVQARVEVPVVTVVFNTAKFLRNGAGERAERSVQTILFTIS